jgi:tetratricopeptide (TPR) repeat protein
MRHVFCVAKQDYDNAIADYNEAVRLDPKSTISFHRRGIAYAAKQDYDRATASLNDAVSIRNLLLPFYGYTLSMLAQVLRQNWRPMRRTLTSLTGPIHSSNYSLVAEHSKRLSPPQPNLLITVQHNSMSVNGSCCETTPWPPK